MLDDKGFDLWADGYDKSVGVSDEENAYPFAGYKQVLGYIYDRIMRKPKASVLDVGFGTGTLAAKLYEKGFSIYGQDFSAKMLEIASKKMPNARLYQGDFSIGLAAPLYENKYDFIVATYSLHHLDDEQKSDFINALLERLNDNGALFIGDVDFESRAELEECKAAVGDEWDDEEYYFVVDEMRASFPKMEFVKASYCSGIIILTR